MQLLLILIGILFFTSKAAGKDSTSYYQLPDSVRAVSFIADVNTSDKGKKNIYAGIGTKHVKLLLKNQKKKTKVSFHFPVSAQVIAKGLDVNIYKDELEWNFKWELNSNYKLMIFSAVDTIEKFAIYSGYIYLPLHQKWKLIGTCKIIDEPLQITELIAIKSAGKKSNIAVNFSNEMVQTAAGPWQRLKNNLAPLPSPPVPPLINIDSVEQFKIDKDLIENKTSTAKHNIEGVYYNIIVPGDGKSFTINDSITVRYQLRIFGTNDVISGSETETYTFMLKNLIKAWQIAVPLVKTGGKIQLVIPSGLAYSIRTRAPKIPPNSILEFDIEVLDIN